MRLGCLGLRVILRASAALNVKCREGRGGQAFPGSACGDPSLGFPAASQLLASCAALLQGKRTFQTEGAWVPGLDSSPLCVLFPYL